MFAIVIVPVVVELVGLGWPSSSGGIVFGLLAVSVVSLVV